MNWNEQYPKAVQPNLVDISGYIGNPLWQELCGNLESRYKVEPKVEHSICSGAPGWNVKYKKSGRSLCTLYPHDGFFTALVCIGSKEQAEAELLLTNCCSYLQELYEKTDCFNGTRWLMIDVTDAEILTGVLLLIDTRVQKKSR